MGPMWWDEGGLGGPTRVLGVGTPPLCSHYAPYRASGDGRGGPTRVYGVGGVLSGSRRVPYKGWGGRWVPRVFMGLRGQQWVPCWRSGGGHGGPTRVYGVGGVSRGSHRVPYSGLGAPGGRLGVVGTPRLFTLEPTQGIRGVPRVFMGRGILSGSHWIPYRGCGWLPRVFLGRWGHSWVP